LTNFSFAPITTYPVYVN